MQTSRSDFSECKGWYNTQQIETTVKALRQRGFDAGSYSVLSEINNVLLGKIPTDASIGIPGSVTIRELGIIPLLQQRGNKIYQHWKSNLTEETDRDDRRLEGTADFFLTSANAITLQGDIINIDGVGNRVADMIFGPAHVVIIAGINKLVGSIEEGINRSKHIAGVMNAKRVGAKTPCVTTGVCSDCAAPQRICRVMSVIQFRPFQTEMSIMLMNKVLGF